MFDGVTYSAERDEDRLHGQLKRVFGLMKDSQWRTLQDIKDALGTNDMLPAISARLRDFRKPKFGQHEVKRRHIMKGLWAYQLIPRQGEDN